MVAGGQFTAPKGYPALPWGCGPLLRLKASAPRWLVLDPEEVETRPGQWIVHRARIVADGTRSDALRYLHENGAAGKPYVGRRRTGHEFAVISVGSAGDVTVLDSGIVSGGQGSRLVGQAGLVAAVGPGGEVMAQEFARIAGGDRSRAVTDRFGHVALGTESQCTVGPGSYAVVGTGSSCTAGPGAKVLSAGGGSIDLAENATGVGTCSTRFRGKDGAVFLVIDSTEAGDVLRMARVGADGIAVGRWYQLTETGFRETSA
jgi:hypothetical protein